ncbi:MAG TPA: serine/threonine-protein kinase, partial [Gemmataceae bacterium]|nr:serine/threonine-protein kinase [Gemmataceae bacterium]
MTEEVLFHAALALPPAERAAYLAEHCPDPDIRRRVEDLLAAHDRVGPLDSPATGDYQSSGPPVADAAGTQIGPYKLSQLIGEGGMGAVYMAEQTSPVRRMVAVKLIKPGMDSRQVLARFEAERQVLALMDHPNIAKVLDAGTIQPLPPAPSPKRGGGEDHSGPPAPLRGGGWGEGLPYFVMELVKGIPITKYCDDNHLTPRERLELFVPICQAVQHAHQKGIIHRDLKPSNVLVALYDGKPVPKVIDFGVAKATGGKLTDRTMFTEFGAVVGTLEYMSPEQAELNQLDIDTRSDIYSLGVLLYELLTGTTPFDRKRLKSAAFDEMLRIIREEEPPKPSTRLSGSTELPSIAAQRKMEPAKLSKLVRGELDWIVMKALEKDRGRRYETANGFARDVQRYLADEPVEAGPPSAVYRMRKFVRRNRGRVLAASLVVLVLFGGIFGTAIGLLREEAAWKAEAEQHRLADAAAVAEMAAKNAVLTRNAEMRPLYDSMNSFIDDAERKGKHKLGWGWKATLRQPVDLELYKDALAWRKAKFGTDHPNTLTIMTDLANGYQRLGLPSEALKLHQEAFAIRKARLGTDHSDTLSSMAGISICLAELDRAAEAVPLIDAFLRTAAGKTMNPALIAQLMEVRLRHFEKAKDSAGCRTTAEMWESLERSDASSLYDAACYRAVAAAVGEQAPGADSARVARADADRAIAWLRKAIA